MLSKSDTKAATPSQRGRRGPGRRAGTRRRLGTTPAPSPEALDAYLAELGDSLPLSRHEELEVAQRIDAARRESIDALLESGIRLTTLEEMLANLEAARTTPEELFDLPESQPATALLAQLEELLELEERFDKLAARLAGRKVTGDARSRIREQMRKNREKRNRLARSIPFSRKSTLRMIEAFEESLQPLAVAEQRIAAHCQRLGKSEKALKAALRSGKVPSGVDATELERVGHAFYDAEQTIRAVEQDLGRSRLSLRAAWTRLSRARAIEERAKSELTTANLRLVVAFARKYRGRGVPLGDLIQEGNIGLMTAVEKFDHRAGTKFSTYASWWLRQSMQRAVINQGRTVRVPIHVAVSSSMADRARHRMTQILGREPDLEELALEMGVTIEDLKKLEGPKSTSVSLQQPIGEEGRMELVEVLADESATDPQVETILSDRRHHARKALRVLSPREQLVVTMRFGLDGKRAHTLREIGEVLGCTRERVRQIEAKALKRLRQAMLAVPL